MKGIRIGVYGMILVSTIFTACFLAKGFSPVVGILFASALFICLNVAYGKIVICIEVYEKYVIFESINGAKIQVTHEDILSIRKTMISDHEMGSFTFHIKGIGAIMAGIMFTEPIVIKNGKRYAEIRKEDFPFADFIHFDE